MNTYVAIIGGKAVLTFRAVDDDQARAMIDDQEGSMRSDLKVLVDANGKPLWDGKSAIRVQEATAAQHAEWKRSRDQAISDGEIDLTDARQYARRVRRQSPLSEFAGSDHCRFVRDRKRTRVEDWRAGVGRSLCSPLVEVFQDVPTAREKPWKFVVEVS